MHAIAVVTWSLEAERLLKPRSSNSAGQYNETIISGKENKKQKKTGHGSLLTPAPGKGRQENCLKTEAGLD